MMFNIGDRIVCKNNYYRSPIHLGRGLPMMVDRWHDLTIDKTYIVEDKDDIREFIIIKNDNDISQWCDINNFISLKEFRKKKLSKIFFRN